MNLLKDKSALELYKINMQMQFDDLKDYIVNLTMLADSSDDYCTDNSDFNAADYLNMIKLVIYDMYKCSNKFEEAIKTEFEKYNKMDKPSD